jgi:hypothetical protein
MSWLARLFGFKEELPERIARDYALLSFWGLTLEKDWQDIENRVLQKLEETGIGG